MNNVTTSSLTMQLSLTPLHCNFAQNPPFCRITPLIITFLSEMREIPQVLQRPRMPRDKKDDTDCSSLKIGYYHTFAHHSLNSVCDFRMYEANVNYEANGPNLAMFPPSPTGSLQSILPNNPSGDNPNVSSESAGNFRSP